MAKYTSSILREVKGKDGKRRAWKGVLKYKDKDGKWKQVAKTFGASVRTKSQANKELQSWRDEMEQAAITTGDDRGEMELLEYMREYVDKRESLGIIEKSTAADYRHTITRLEKRFADTKLKDLTADMVDEFQLSEQARGVSVTTCGKVHRLLKQVLTYALKRGHIEKNVMAIVEPPKRPKKRPNGLDLSEAQRVTELLINMPPTSVCTAAFLALHASLRAGEACGLQWSDVHLDQMTVTVRQSIGLGDGGAYLKTPKNDSSIRDVNITKDLADKLRERRDHMHGQLAKVGIMLTQEQFSKLFVCGNVVGDFLNPHILARKWSALAEAHSITGTEGKQATFHTLRHGYATVAVSLGVDVATVAGQMGHATTSVTLNTYTSATAQGKARAAEAMGNAMHPGKSADILTIEKTGTD